MEEEEEYYYYLLYYLRRMYVCMYVLKYAFIIAESKAQKNAKATINAYGSTSI